MILLAIKIEVLTDFKGITLASGVRNRETVESGESGTFTVLQIKVYSVRIMSLSMMSLS